MYITCQVCGMKYEKQRGYDDPEHRSYHRHYLHVVKQYGSDLAVNIGEWKNREQDGYGKIRTLEPVLMKEGAHDVLLVHFNLHLYHTRKYLPFSVFVRGFDMREFDELSQRAFRLYQGEKS